MLILVSGGSASGKSEFAESLIVDGGPGPRYYIATMQVFDKESEKRVERHRTLRAGKGFCTLERQTDLEGIELPAGGAVLLECMSNLVANECFSGVGFSRAVESICAGVEAVSRRSGLFVIVTNEVFAGGTNYEGETRAYLDCLGAINSRIAAMADAVYEVVCGIPLKLK